MSSFNSITEENFDPEHSSANDCDCPMCLSGSVIDIGGDGTGGDGNGGDGGDGGDNGGDNNPGGGGNDVDTSGPTSNPLLPISTNNLPGGGLEGFFGTNPPASGSAGPLAPRNVITFYQGDRIALAKSVPLIDGVVATSQNSEVTFTLSDERFFPTPLWVGTWADGIEPTNDAGGILISLPHSLSSTLRRGAYLFSLSLQAKIGANTRETFEEGIICIEYGANAPNPDVPYRTTDGNQNTPN